jgi:arsenate reductase (glutaredoxin)
MSSSTKPTTPATTTTRLDGPTLYGIPNCDTVKRARAWLAERQVDTAFHDFKKQGVPEARLDAWLDALGWQALINTRGTTWRKLDEPTRTAVTDRASARRLMLAQPSVIKRPVVEWQGGATTAGFDPDDWASRHR